MKFRIFTTFFFAIIIGAGCDDSSTAACPDGVCADMSNCIDGDCSDASSCTDASCEDGGQTDGGADMGNSDGGLDMCADGGCVSANTCYEDDTYTCVDVGVATYGERTFDVVSTQNWVNTGLYMYQGDTVEISATGSFLPGVIEDIDHGTCRAGDLVARIGLHFKDNALNCIDGQATVTADKDGILFVGMLPSNDLGESYETRVGSSGSAVVTVRSDGPTAPTVDRSKLEGYPFGEIQSGWVELAGEHVILTIPTSLALFDLDKLGAALDRFDAIYEIELELRGAPPQHGQRIRFFPDGTAPGWMVAGNPVRMDHGLIDPNNGERVTNAGAAPEVAQIWGFAHELGHDFTFVGGGWAYQTATALESWPNLFSIYSFEKLGVPLHESTASCTANSTGSYGDAAAPWGGDVWLCLCFLRQFQFELGWEFYQAFFASLNTMNRAQINTAAGGDPWRFVYEQFQSAAANESERQFVTDTFDAWGVPRPGGGL